MIAIGPKIYRLRREQGLSQAVLAARADIPQPNLSNIEKGKQDMTVMTLRKIAYALGVSPKDFFEEPFPETAPAGLSRKRIERIAAAVTGQAVRLTPEEKNIVRLISPLIPTRKKTSRASIHRLNAAWLKLREQFTKEEIKSLCERVEDARVRGDADEAKTN